MLEFRLDEKNKTGSVVWSWVPSPEVRTWHVGNAWRLPNGNTFIGWGGALDRVRVPAFTEVTAADETVLGLFFKPRSPSAESDRAFRFLWPLENGSVSANIDCAAGTNCSLEKIGLSLRLTSSDGGRSHLNVYHRVQNDTGLFIPQATSHDPTYGTIRAFLTIGIPPAGLSEMIFGYPDLPEVPYALIIAEAENDRGLLGNRGNIATNGTPLSLMCTRMFRQMMIQAALRMKLSATSG